MIECSMEQLKSVENTLSDELSIFQSRFENEENDISQPSETPTKTNQSSNHYNHPKKLKSFADNSDSRPKELIEVEV